MHQLWRFYLMNVGRTVTSLGGVASWIPQAKFDVRVKHGRVLQGSSSCLPLSRYSSTIFSYQHQLSFNILYEIVLHLCTNTSAVLRFCQSRNAGENYCNTVDQTLYIIKGTPDTSHQRKNFMLEHTLHTTPRHHCKNSASL